MRHQEINEKILALYEGPLTEKERLLVESHLAGCVECQKTVEEYRALSSRLFTLPIFSEASEDTFVTKVMARIESSPKTTLSWNELILRWMLPLVGSAVAAVWVCFFVLPETPDFASEMNGSSYFSSDAHEMSSSWSVLPAGNTREEIVVSLLKE